MDIRNYFGSSKGKAAAGATSATTGSKEKMTTSEAKVPSKDKVSAIDSMQTDKEQISPNLNVNSASNDNSSKESHQLKSRTSKRNKVSKITSAPEAMSSKTKSKPQTQTQPSQSAKPISESQVSMTKSRKKRKYGEFLADNKPVDEIEEAVQKIAATKIDDDPAVVTSQQSKTSKQARGKKKAKLEKEFVEKDPETVTNQPLAKSNASQTASQKQAIPNTTKAPSEPRQLSHLSKKSEAADDMEIDMEMIQELVEKSEMEEEEEEVIKPQTRKPRRAVLNQLEDDEPTVVQKQSTVIQKEKEPSQPKESTKTSAPDIQGVDDVLPDAFDGLNFVVSGVFEGISREKLEQFIITKGGFNKTAVSGKTNYLIVGNKLEDGREVNQGTKYRNALLKKVQILTEEEFEQWVKRRTGLKNFQFCIRHQILEVETKQPVGSMSQKSATVNTQRSTVDPSSVMWTDRYKPSQVKDIVGNRGQVNSLFEFLRDWDKVHVQGIKKELPPQRGFSRGAWGNAPKLNAKAALVSGPPGIGKTSACRIICELLGFEVLEMNASDCRNKLAIQSTISLAASNTSIDYWTVAGQKKQEQVKNNQLQQAFGGQIKKKSVIIMDECDGVGAGDRGGLQALLQVIKTTKAPIVCICNDRQHEKIQSIANHSLDVKFQRPSKIDIAQRIKQIQSAENIRIDDHQLQQLIESSGNDIRQVINIMQMWHTQLKESSHLQLSSMMKDEKVMINNFDAASRLLNQGNAEWRNKYKTYRDKQDLFFIDYDFVPSLVQENYLNSIPDHCHELQDIERMADAADLISHGDLLNIQIRQNQNWSLLPDYGTMSSVAPCILIQGQLNYPAFPQALGKFSTMRKCKRLAREVKQALSSMSCGGSAISASKMAVQTEFVPLLLLEIVNLLHGNQIPEVIELLDEIKFTNEMVKEHLVCLSLDKKLIEKLDSVPTQVKSAFTRAYNKHHSKGIKGGKGAKGAKQAHDESSDEDANSDSDGDVIDAALLDEEQIKEIKRAKAAEKDIKKQMKQLKKLEEKAHGGSSSTVPSSLQILKKGGKNSQDDDQKKPKGGAKGKGGKATAAADKKSEDDEAEDIGAAPAKKGGKGAKGGAKTQQTKAASSNVQPAAKKGKKNKTQKKKDEDEEDAGGGLAYF